MAFKMSFVVCDSKRSLLHPENSRHLNMFVLTLHDGSFPIKMKRTNSGPLKENNKHFNATMMESSQRITELNIAPSSNSPKRSNVPLTQT